MKKGFSRRAFMGSAVAGVGAMTMASLERTAAASQAIPLAKPLDLHEIGTPALLIDLDVMEANMRKMAAHMKAQKTGLRPHSKTHKCPIIAQKQIDLGAVGVCAAKVSEAEVMVAAGIGNVLITSPVVSPEKIDRVIALAKASPGLQIVCDNPKTVQDFNQAATEAGTRLTVLVGLDTGTRRTGIALGKPALGLVEEIHKSTALAFGGIQAYAGHLMHVNGHEQRKKMSRETLARCLETKALVQKAGFEVPVFTVGGTGTFDIDCNIEGVTDIQAGSYLFMDSQYREVGDSDSETFDYFEPALFVLVTAISQPVPELITVDGGYKAMASDAKPPVFRNQEGLIYHWGGDEHGICQFKDPKPEVKLGDKLQLIVPHCDPTVNLYDHYHPYRNGKVEELWPIAARGHSQ